jgi:hypothetical protein
MGVSMGVYGGILVEEPKSKVIENARHKKLVIRVLENEPDALAHFNKGFFGYFNIANRYASLLRQQNSISKQHKGRFARAVRAEQGNVFPMPQLKRHTPERLRAIRVGKSDILIG